MHETLHTYHFLSLRRKNTFPSFHTSWRKSFLYYKNLLTFLMKKCPSFVKYCSKLQKRFVLCLSTIFSFPKFVPKVNTLSPSCSDALCCMMLMLCKMMWWCYVMQNDICAADTYPCNKALILFISALTFRCKPPLGASSPFTFSGISVYFSL
jgi:hypothetical protein